MKEFRALETRSFLLVYGALLAICLISDTWTYGSPWANWLRGSGPTEIAWILAAVFVIGYLFVAILMARWFQWVQDLEASFRLVLTPISYFQILLLSIFSGFAEEWFFRGVLLERFGLVLSSVVFGLAHWIPLKRLWLWSFWTLGVGVCLGLFYYYTRSLILVSLMHAVINAVLLFRLNIQPKST